MEHFKSGMLKAPWNISHCFGNGVQVAMLSTCPGSYIRPAHAAVTLGNIIVLVHAILRSYFPLVKRRRLSCINWDSKLK